MNTLTTVKVTVPGDIPLASDSLLYHASALFFSRWIYHGKENPEAYDELFKDIQSLFKEDDVNELFDECLLLTENILNDPLNALIKNIIESHQYTVSVEGVCLLNWSCQQFLYLVELIS